MRIRMQIILSMRIHIRIQIQGSNPMDPDPGRTYEDTIFFLKVRKLGLFVHLVNFNVPGSGSAFPICIRIQDRQSQCRSMRIRMFKMPTADDHVCIYNLFTNFPVSELLFKYTIKS